MKITRITIDNYKSIKHIECNVSDKLNVFVGENSVGKSNIFNALEWLLGPVYPSFNSVSKGDYYMGNNSLPVKVIIHFDDDNFLAMESNWCDKYNKEKSGLHLNAYDYVTDDIRQRYVSAFLGIDRKITENPAANRWTILGRLLQEINARFIQEEIVDEKTGEKILKSEKFKASMNTIKEEFLFSVKDSNGNKIMQAFQKILQEETARQLNRSPSEFSLDLNMYDPWNFYRTLQIIVSETDTNMTFRASELGMGVQASLTIAILKAYSQLKLKNSTPIFIDEPELFLHPQGRRNFYNILRELSETGTQVFVTTHSTEFIDLHHFDEINIIRKSNEKGTYIRKADPQKFVEDYYVRYNKPVSTDDLMSIYANAFENTGDSQKSSEAIFARKIILVEGESEVLILPYFFSLLGFDPITNGVTIVRCGGKSELDRFYRLYSEFGIPCFIIFDGDYQHCNNPSKQTDTIKKNKGILSIFNESLEFPDNIVHDNYLGFKYRLEENLNIKEVGDNAKSIKLYKRVKETIVKKEQVPKWVSDVIEKLKALPTESPSILKTEPKNKHF